MSRGRNPPRLTVGAATARALQRGHPWVVRDGQTGSVRGLPCGALVELTGPRGTPLGLALADPDQRVVARRIDRPGGRFAPRERAYQALGRRRTLLADGDTDVYRLIHGEADGLPGLFVDRYGDALVAVRHAPCAATFAEEVYAVLQGALEIETVWEKDHFEDLRRDGLQGRLWAGDACPGEDRVVRERGLRFVTTPFGGLATGIYPDQRANRERLSRRGAPGRTLNMLAYTGAFAVAALAAGATEAVDVDLSGPSLRRAERNVDLNELPADRHAVRRTDAIRFIERAERGSYDTAIVDPPTAARGGKGWSARRGLDRLLTATLAAVRDGGVVLVCLNDRRADREHLTGEVHEAARLADRRIHQVRPAAPGLDYPILAGFPESRSFVGLWIDLT